MPRWQYTVPRRVKRSTESRPYYPNLEPTKRHMRFDENPYYHPEKCGLAILWSVDTADSYEFDIFVVWEKLDDHTLWYDSDSGCSCPSPFDNADNGHDLKPITKDTWYNFKQAIENHSRIDQIQVIDCIEKVKRYVRTKQA